MKRELGSFESAQAITNEHYPFNVVSVLGLDNGPPPDTLRQALAILRQRHPLLRARVIRDGRRLQFRLDERLAIPLNVIPRASAQRWREVAEHELNTSVDGDAGPAFRFTYLESASNAACELIITAQHTVFDAVSGTHLLGELLTLCQALADGETPGNFEPLPLCAAADQYFPAPFSGWRGRLRTVPHIAREIGHEIAFRWRNRGVLQPVAKTGRCKIFPVQLSESATHALARRCQRENVTVNSALSAAQLLVARERLPGYKAHRSFVFADLRPYLTPSLGPEHLGSYFAALRLATHDVQSDLWTVARSFGRQVHAASRRGDKFTSVLLSKAMIEMLFKSGKDRMGETALAYGGDVRLDEQYGAIRVTALNAFVSNFVLGPPFTANARRFLGRLWWDMVYLDSDMDGEAAARFAKAVVEQLSEV